MYCYQWPKIKMNKKNNPLLQQISIYIHWPFCLSKCPYCDFNSHVRTNFDYKKMISAYISEIHSIKNFIHDSPLEIGSIFFGGGTPSLMPPKFVEKIISTLERYWKFSDKLEISLEANPNSVDLVKFNGFKNAGVNRLSLGVQALNDKDLKFLGRSHTCYESLKALDIASKIFKKTSIGLIYGRPKQSTSDWELELSSALKLPINHISLYQLTIEKGTQFFTDARDKKFIMPNENYQNTMFNISNIITEQAGFTSYEISNYARPNFTCKHNLTYWLYKPYIGIGPGAHGRMPAKDGGRVATRMHSKPETWLDAVCSNGHGIAQKSAISAKERATEALILGLRLTEGINKKHFETNTGVKFNDAVIASEIKRLEEKNYIVNSEQKLKLTKHGRPLLNSILSHIAAYE